MGLKNTWKYLPVVSFFVHEFSGTERKDPLKFMIKRFGHAIYAGISLGLASSSFIYGTPNPLKWSEGYEARISYDIVQCGDGEGESEKSLVSLLLANCEEKSL